MPTMFSRVDVEKLSQLVGEFRFERFAKHLALLSKKAVKAKYALGKDNQKFVNKFHFSLQTNNLFSKLIDTPEAIWVEDSQNSKIAVNEEVRLVLASKAFYLMPLILSERVIGFIYADRQPSSRELDNESFESFKHFVQQANQALGFIAKR